MDPQRWRLIEELFHAASDVPAHRRPAFLDHACQSDPTLRADVEALLETLDEPDVILRQAVSQEAGSLLESVAPELQSIGPYRILRRLGQGGMGSVYLAVRADDQYDKQVAIKLIRAGHEQRSSLLRRFLNERQILANLEHPHIARLLDGGVTPDGHPYLVMEYVDGQPIDAYAAAKNLDIPQRLRLFLEVCDAVSHAHRHMVIHRDLKPSNILVNSEGTAKLLDFGIAKIARPSEESFDATLTTTADRMLTPDYASPEMLRGDRITAAADIYCLGIILYELLTLARPYRVATSSLFAVERAILTSQPPRPSTVPGSLLLPLSRDRRLDLDAIISKAMRPDPADRYDSVAALTADIHAYLNAFPVRARLGSRRYHFRKFVLRHRLAVAASAALALTIIGSAVALAIFASRAARERDSAQAVSSFLVSMFASADPRQARGETVTARDLLDRGIARVNNDLKNQPNVQIRLLSTIGEAYQFLGLLKEAEDAYFRQFQLEQSLSGPQSPNVIAALRQLADIRRMRGNNAQARQDLRQALASQRAIAGPNALELSHILNNLALIEQSLGNISQCVGLFREAVRIISLYPKEAEDALTMRGNLASALQEWGDLENAESEMLAVATIRTQTLGPDHPQRLRSLLRLSRLLLRNGAYSQASQNAAEALPIAAKVLGPRHSDTLSLRVLQAEIQHQFHPGPQLAATLDEIVRTDTTIRGPLHPDVLSWTILAAANHPHPGPAQSALCRSSLTALEERLDANSPILARGLEACAGLSLRTADPASARELATRAVAIHRRIHQPNHPYTAVPLGLAAQAELALGNPTQAERLLREAIEIDRLSLRRPHLQTEAHLALLAALLQRQGKPEASQLSRQAQALRDAIFSAAKPAAASSHVPGSGTSAETSPVTSNAQRPVR